MLIILEMMNYSLVLFPSVILSLNVLSCIFLFKCNPNMFGQFFNFNISLNFEESCIPTSLYFSLFPIIHPSIIVVVFCTLNFVLCATYVRASCAHGCLFFFSTNVCISSSDYQLILVFSTCDFMISRSKPKEGTNLKSPIKDVLKSCFLVLMRRKLNILLKVMKNSIIMLNSSEKCI